MKRLLEFWQDNNGKLSNTRLGAFLIVLTFIADWWSNILIHSQFDPSWSIVGLVTSVIGLKVLQSKNEKRRD